MSLSQSAKPSPQDSNAPTVPQTPDKCLLGHGTSAAAAKSAPSTVAARLKKLVRPEGDIKLIFKLAKRPEHEPYYPMKRGHLTRMNDVLLKISNAGPEIEDGIVKAKDLIKQGVNPDLMRHAFGIYLTHSRDAQRRHIYIPPLKNHAMLLNKPAPLSSATAAGSTGTTIVPGEVVTPDTLQGPAILSYWCEDYDFNDHHVHWHMVYPGTGVVVGGKNVRVIDRQGELFLYMHSQIIARYETEAKSWNLPLVRPWNQYDDMLEYPYVPVPGLVEYYGGHAAYSSWWATRNPNIPNTEDAPLPRAALESWRDNIYQSIKDGFFWTKNEQGDKKRFPLDDDNVHDVVGTIIESESSALLLQPDGYSFDESLYGNLHNFGHDKFGEMGYHTYLSETAPYGLMISNFGSPRSSAFYPWHKHIQYFGRLAAAKYPQDITQYKAAVTLSHLSIRMINQDAAHYMEGLTTWLGPPAINLLESKAKLDHEPYQWRVQIQSTLNPPPTQKNPQTITLRLFIAAKELMEDYQNWIEMDKYTVTLTSDKHVQKGRLDTDSSVVRKMGNYSEDDPQYEASTWCRCGWNRNMMLPVGKPEGMPFVAFVMATNDKVSTDVKTPALSYCGAMNTERKYPDPRGMGYPFNREWTQEREESKARISTIITDNAKYPFMMTYNFKVFRTTKYFLDTALNPPHIVSNATWNSPIKSYFRSSDVTCMLNEYGYDLSNYEDVLLHSSAILDATRHKRMPLQMPPFTQDNPDPEHPMWTDEMCNTFEAWISNGCPQGAAPPPPTPPPTSATWDNTIKEYFLLSDVQCMSGRFDLSNHDSVKEHAKAIYDAVSNGSMPLQMEPYTQQNPDPKHPLWTKEKCDTFNAWMQNGCP